MNTPVNHNNLVEIIQNQIDTFTNVIKVFNNISEIAMLKMTERRIKSMRSVLDIITNFVQEFNKLEVYSKTAPNLNNLVTQIKQLHQIVFGLMNLIEVMSALKKYKKRFWRQIYQLIFSIQSDLLGIIESINSIQSIFATINSTQSDAKKAMNNLLLISDFISILYKTILKWVAALAHLNIVIKTSIRHTDNIILFFIQISRLITRIQKVTVTMDQDTVKKINIILKSILILFLRVRAIAAQLIIMSPILIVSLLCMPVVILFFVALTGFFKIVGLVLRVLDGVMRHRDLRSLRNILKILLLVELIASHIILLSIISAVALICIPIVLLFFAGVALIAAGLKLMLMIVKFFMKNNIGLVLGYMLGVLLLVNMVAASILILGVLALQTLPYTLSIFKLIGVIVLITLSLTVLGVLTASAGSFIGVALVGLLMIFTLVGILTMIAGALFLLGQLSLNADRIKENVYVVMDTAWEVVTGIFDQKQRDNYFDRKNKTGDPKNQGFINNLLGGMLSGLMGVISLIGSIPYLSLVFISIGLILFIATALRLLQIFELNPDRIFTNIDSVFDTADQIINRIFNNDNDTDPTNQTSDAGKQSIITSLLGHYINGINHIIALIASISYLTLTFIAIGMVLFITTALRILQEINIDQDRIFTNINTIFDTVDLVVNSIFNPEMFNRNANPSQEKETPWYAKLFDWVKPVLAGATKYASIIASIPYLMLTMLSIGIIHRIVKQLNTINSFKISKEGISKKIVEIINISNSLITTIFKKSDIARINPFKANQVIGSMNQLIRFITVLHKLPKNTDETDAISKNLKSYHTITSDAFSLLSYIQKQDIYAEKIHKNLDIFDRINKIYGGFSNISDTDIAKSEKLTNNYVKFIDKINGTNLNNLKTAEQLFRHMSEFTKSINGNFDALAQALNDKIAPLLEELKRLLNQVPDTIQEASQSIQQATYQAQSGITDPLDLKKIGFTTEKAEQISRNTRKVSESEYKNMEDLEKIVTILEGLNSNGGVVVSKY